MIDDQSVFNGMARDQIKVLENKFADLKAGQKMLIASPEMIVQYIQNIPYGTQKTTQQMRVDLAKARGADHTCPVTTGIFLRQVIKAYGQDIPFWRVIDAHHRIVQSLDLDPNIIQSLRYLEGIDQTSDD